MNIIHTCGHTSKLQPFGWPDDQRRVAAVETRQLCPCCRGLMLAPDLRGSPASVTRAAIVRKRVLHGVADPVVRELLLKQKSAEWWLTK